mmetsp:Transcript_3687/g.10606  ORF Transcript_3687/g.10606 Transcript_3687/m.10606 type:complete len:1059 (+) Transcript_3687:358-3534(+)
MRALLWPSAVLVASFVLCAYVFDDTSIEPELQLAIKPVQRLKDIVVPHLGSLPQQKRVRTLWGSSTLNHFRHSLLSNGNCYHVSGHQYCYGYTPSPTMAPTPTPGPTSPAPTPGPTSGPTQGPTPSPSPTPTPTTSPTPTPTATPAPTPTQSSTPTSPAPTTTPSPTVTPVPTTDAPTPEPTPASTPTPTIPVPPGIPDNSPTTVSYSTTLKPSGSEACPDSLLQLYVADTATASGVSEERVLAKASGQSDGTCLADTTVTFGTVRSASAFVFKLSLRPEEVYTSLPQGTIQGFSEMQVTVIVGETYGLGMTFEVTLPAPEMPTPSPTAAPTPYSTSTSAPTPDPSSSPAPTPFNTGPTPTDDFIALVDADLAAATADLHPSSIHVTDTSGDDPGSTRRLLATPDDTPPCSKVVLFEMDATDSYSRPPAVHSFRAFVVFPSDADQSGIDQFMFDLENNPEAIFVSFDPSVWTFQLTFGPVQDQLPLDSDRGSECCPGNSGTTSECGASSDGSEADHSSSSVAGKSSSSAEGRSSSEKGSLPASDSDGNDNRARARAANVDSEDDGKGDRSSDNGGKDDKANGDSDNNSGNDGKKKRKSNDGAGGNAEDGDSDDDGSQTEALALEVGFAPPSKQGEVLRSSAFAAGTAFNVSNTTGTALETLDVPTIVVSQPRSAEEPSLEFLQFVGNGTLGDLQPRNWTAAASLAANDTGLLPRRSSSVPPPPNVTVPLLVSRPSASSHIVNTANGHQSALGETGQREKVAGTEQEFGGATLGTFVKDPGGSSMPIIGGMLVNQMSYQAHSAALTDKRSPSEKMAIPSSVASGVSTSSPGTSSVSEYNEATQKRKRTAATAVVLLATIGTLAAATTATMFYKWRSSLRHDGISEDSSTRPLPPLHITDSDQGSEASEGGGEGVFQRMRRTIRETQEAHVFSAMRSRLTEIIPRKRETMSALCAATVDTPAEFDYDCASSQYSMSLDSSMRDSLFGSQRGAHSRSGRSTEDRASVWSRDGTAFGSTRQRFTPSNIETSPAAASDVVMCTDLSPADISSVRGTAQLCLDR